MILNKFINYKKIMLQYVLLELCRLNLIQAGLLKTRTSIDFHRLKCVKNTTNKMFKDLNFIKELDNY